MFNRFYFMQKRWNGWSIVTPTKKYMTRYECIWELNITGIRLVSLFNQKITKFGTSSQCVKFDFHMDSRTFLWKYANKLHNIFFNKNKNKSNLFNSIPEKIKQINRGKREKTTKKLHFFFNQLSISFEFTFVYENKLIFFVSTWKKQKEKKQKSFFSCSISI